MNIREKDLSIALLNAVGALAQRLTGEILAVRIVDSEGHPYWVYASPDAVKWVKSAEEFTQGEVESLHAVHLESADMRREPHYAERAIETAVHRSADLSASP